MKVDDLEAQHGARMAQLKKQFDEKQEDYE